MHHSSRKSQDWRQVPFTDECAADHSDVATSLAKGQRYALLTYKYPNSVVTLIAVVVPRALATKDWVVVDSNCIVQMAGPWPVLDRLIENGLGDKVRANRLSDGEKAQLWCKLRDLHSEIQDVK